jgi:hypothetical protein
MGEALILNAAVIDEDKIPDWIAAEQRIDTVTADEVDDELEVLERYVREPDDQPSDDQPGEDPDIDIERLRRDLRSDLRAFREGVEDRRSDLDYLLVRGARVWVTGGPSWGDDPSDLCSPMRRLHAAGVLGAAGFDSEDDVSPATSPALAATNAAR